MSLNIDNSTIGNMIFSTGSIAGSSIVVDNSNVFNSMTLKDGLIPSILYESEIIPWHNLENGQLLILVSKDCDGIPQLNSVTLESLKRHILNEILESLKPNKETTKP